MFKSLLSILFLLYLIHEALCDVVIVDSDKKIGSPFYIDSVLNLEDNVCNIFLDKKGGETIKNTYKDHLSAHQLEIEAKCAQIRKLLKGRNLKYFDSIETQAYVKSKVKFDYSIYVYHVTTAEEIKKIYQKHPNYISLIASCEPNEIFENIEAVKNNEYRFYTTPNILSQLIVVGVMLFFLIIGVYVLMNISTPKIFEEKQLIINKEN